MPFIAASIVYVGEKILAQIIKEEVWAKRLYFFFFPPKTYKNELEHLLLSTIEEFRKKFPKEPIATKIQFYEDEEIFEKLSMFILFEKNEIDILVSNFVKKENVITPTQDEIDFFYNYFVKKVNSNKIIKNLFLEENFKNQIFELTKVLDEIKNSVKSIKNDTEATRGVVESLAIEKEYKKLTPEKTIKALHLQVNRQLKKQINSGKYLQNIFIETGEQKDNLRYLCDSIFYSQKCCEEINNLDFRLLNVFLKSKGISEFILDFESLKTSEGTMDVKNASQMINNWYNHLTLKKEALNNLRISSNQIYRFERKFKDPLNDLSFLKSRVVLITEIAGQGKTNLLCDFSENFLVKREIPTLFLTGNEINATDIRYSILKKIFPDNIEYTFEDLLNNLRAFCYEQKKYFILIIDGINENSNSKLLSQNLELLIGELLEYDFIKIVLSCRSEYYQMNFINIEKSSFASEIQKITSIWSHHPNDELKEKLFDLYFNHFNIVYHNISSKAYDQLVTNFLLLRIFCETYQNQNLEYIENIYKEELFEKYYSIKSEEINKRLRENDEFNITGTFDIKNFISNVVEYMIEKRIYVNVPFDKLIKDTKDTEIFVRFLDENILVRRDLQTNERGIFTPSEVVNFTFDEFRDFLISRYLIESLYKKSQDDFLSFIESQVTAKSPLLEGCGTFLFFISRRSLDEVLNDILSRQPWFEEVFSECIFYLQDSKVTDADKKALSSIFSDNASNNDSIILNLVHRNNTEKYKKLNIDFLFEMLRELEEDQYMISFANKFGNKHSGYYQINQEKLLNNISELFDKGIKDTSHHKIFELLIYMYTNKSNWQIKLIYTKYFYQNADTAKKQLTEALMCKNEILKKELNQFISDNEISL